MMDTEPTDENLDTIRNWNPSDLHGLMDYIKPIWRYADSGYWREVLRENGQAFHLHTAGWSDNEEIIGAMMGNHIWWMMFWESSRRGGHYVFSPIGADRDAA